MRPAVILAQGDGSLGAARVLGRRGVPIIAALWDPVTPLRYSRFTGRTLVIPPGSIAEREAHLLRLLMELDADRPTLFATSDRLITFVARHRETLAGRFALCVPDIGLIDILNDKAREVELVGRLGFAIPKTLSPIPASAADIEAQLGLPVIFKPRSFEHLGLISGKNVVIHERGALQAFCREHGGRFGGLIAQEVIPGPDDANWTCSCTFNRAHEMLAAATKRKLRMMPAHFGVSTLAVSASNPTLLELARRLGRALRYSGPAVIEFHWDHRDGSYKYLELNPRIHLTVEFDDFCGIPTVWHAYRAALGENASHESATQRDGLFYFDWPGDLRARLADGERLSSILIDHVRMLPRKKDGLYFQWDDPLPGLWIARRVLRAGIRRLGGRRRGQRSR